MEREEDERVSELEGQRSLADYIEMPEIEGTGNREQGTGMAEEGWDEQGRLIDPGKGGETSSVTPLCGATPSPEGKAFGSVDDEAQDDEAKLEALAGEINAIKAQTRSVVLGAALEIGKRLVAARALSPHGHWAGWLKEHVDYSERTAQDLMRLYEEYGKRAMPEAVARLDYSKAVTLLSLPGEQREALAARALEEDLSVRQLRGEVERLKKENADQQLRLEALLGEKESLEEDAEDRRREAEETAEAALRQERAAAERARAEARAAHETAEALRKERDEARKTSQVETERAAAAVERANQTQEQLREAEARLKAMESEDAIPDTVREELERLRDQAQRGDALTRLKLGYERLLLEIKNVESLLQEVRAQDADAGARYAAALAKACERMKERLG